MLKKLLALLLITINLTACATTKILPTNGGEVVEWTMPLTTSTVSTTVVTTTPPPPPPKKASVALAGDVLLHTQVWKAADLGEDKYDFTPFFADIKPYVEAADFAICNLENPVDVDGGNQNLSTYPQFNAPYEILDGIKYMGFDAVTTANNHSFDKHFEGLCATLENVEKCGLLYTGTYETAEDYNEYLIKEVNGINIAVLSYSQLDNGMSGVIPSDKRSFAMRRFDIDDTSLTAMAEDMQNCRDLGADIVITALHWGAEYVDYPTSSMEDFAHKLAENGADIVWGGHSHCVQPAEWVSTDRGQSLILYSLGNFFVDQIGLQPPQAKTAYGAVVTINIEEIDGGFSLSADLLPTYTYRYTNDDGSRAYQIIPEGATNAPESAIPAFQHVESIISF
ncbi:MAG: CapA family protein [Oscillospiraceae bacterium]|jgi:poly-gamma-glutamate synthesis protein (capsule biosynthesis protein)|nr:CapA family protein [Oscillospiraceae bacterium]